MRLKKALAYVMSAAMFIGLIPAAGLAPDAEVSVKAADTVDAAIYAVPSSDYTSAWENLNGINNPDFEPSASNMVSTGLGWGNWPQDAGSGHYIQYDWDYEITTDAFQIYWYDDGGGTRVPKEISFEYLDDNGTSWKPLNMISEYNSITAVNRYNFVSVEKVTTKGIRMNMTVADSAQAMGVYRFKVMVQPDDAFTDQVLAYVSQTLSIGPRLSANMQLTESLPNGVKVTWTEDHDALEIVNGNQLIVTRGDEDVAGTITAHISFNGKTADKEFSVTAAKKVPEIEGMLAKYDFSGLSGTLPAGTYISDISGHGNDAAVRGSGVTASDNAITLPGGAYGSSAGYVELPKGMFDGQDQLTLSMWIKNDQGPVWTSAFFFGKDTESYFMINPENPTSDTAKMCITWSGSGGETGLSPGSDISDGPVTGSDWTHYTAVITENSITGYINGEKYKTYALSRKVSDMGTGLSSFIGRSFYPDPFFMGSVKAVSIYNIPMDDKQVGELYTEGLTDTEILQNVSKALDIPEVKDNVLSTSMYDSLTLDSSVLGDLVTIDWESSDESVIGTDGKINAPDENKTVKLTAVLKIRDTALRKEFNILVLAKDETAYEMTVDMNDKGVDISKELFGLFYEDINSAGDGGLSPEMVKNNSFENYYDVATPNEVEHGNQSTWKWSWSSSNSSNFVVEQKDGLNENNTNYAKITGNMTLTNNGFAEIYDSSAAAMPIVKGNSFDFSMFMKADSSYAGSVKVKAVNASGTAITDEKQLTLVKDGTWQKVSETLTGNATEKGKLVLTFEGANASDAMYIDMVSLIPQDSYGYGNKNYAYGAGIRKDLVDRLKALKPSFIRFPGGCVVEGDSGKNSFYNWENSVGPLEERKATANYWGKQEYFYDYLDNLKYGYMMSYEFGYHEILTLCEDLGAEAFPILSAGIYCQFKDSAQAASGKELDQFAKYATDLLDYCWGDPNSSDEQQAYWAKKRVQNGHTEPFELHYMGIGNENWNDSSRGVNYFDNFEYIKNIVDAYGKKNYPERYADFTLISSTGPYAEGSMMDDAWNWVNKSMPGETLVDEHYYMGLSWMLDNTHRYDSYKRLEEGGSDVFVGEYAVNSSINTLEAAIGEAAYMTGLERNADIVRHASYAPLLQKVGAANWSPNLIYFDEYNTMGTPNYYVQYMYSNNYGSAIVNTKLNKVNNSGNYTALSDRQKDIYQVSSMDEQYIYLKLVNHDSYDKGITIRYPGVSDGAEAEIICLSGDGEAVNDMGNETVIPVSKKSTVMNGELKYVVPAMSFTVIKVKYTDFAYEKLTGDLSISGEAQSGSTVCAVIAGSNNTGKYSYQWKADGNDIAGAVSRTYTIPGSMAGKKISVTVTSSKETGELSAEMNGKVDEKEKPDKSSLKAAIERAEQYNQSDYTKESWDMLMKELERAKDVLNNEDATEAEVEGTLFLLQEAIDWLKSADNPTEPPEETQAPDDTKPEPTKAPDDKPDTSPSPSPSPSSVPDDNTQKMPEDTVKNGDTAVIDGVEYCAADVEKGQAAACGVSSKTLKKIRIADSVVIKGTSLKVTSVNAGVFAGMKKLKKVTIGKNVTSIGKKAFFKDKKLKSVVIKSKKLKKVKAKAFAGINKKAAAKVPKACKKKYKKLLKNKGKLLIK